MKFSVNNDAKNTGKVSILLVTEENTEVPTGMAESIKGYPFILSDNAVIVKVSCFFPSDNVSYLRTE